MASTRMKRSVTIKKGPDSEATSVNGDKKAKRATSTGPNKGLPDSSLDPLFQPRALVPEYFDYNDALTENQIANMRERAIQRAIQLQKEKSRKAKLSRIGQSDEEGDRTASQADITKKDMTTDH